MIVFNFQVIIILLFHLCCSYCYVSSSSLGYLFNSVIGSSSSSRSVAFISHVCLCQLSLAVLRLLLYCFGSFLVPSVVLVLAVLLFFTFKT